jgi:hypothetical protein
MGVLKALCSQEMDTIRISKKVTNMRQTSIQMTWIVPKQPKEETWLPGSKMPHNAFLHTFIQSAQFLVTLMLCDTTRPPWPRKVVSHHFHTKPILGFHHKNAIASEPGRQRYFEVGI